MNWRTPVGPVMLCIMHTSTDDTSRTLPPTDAVVLARRRAAHGLAAIVGCDHRTAMRALEQGVEAIRPLRLREELRFQLMSLTTQQNDTTR